jgi:beta-lactamase superfamily II metal-dependent hydrolase
MFALEALQANDGDCLLLHYGSGRKTGLIVIDGGPATIYKSVLKPRLDELRGQGTLDLRMVMVSHIDADHITGVLDMFKDLAKCDSAGKPRPYRIHSLWHNSFEKLGVAKKASVESKAVAAAVSGAMTPPAGLDGKVKAVVASVQQGSDLQNCAIQLRDVKLNAETQGGLVMAPKSGSKTIAIDTDAGLSFTVLGPRQEEIDALEAEWEKTKAKPGAKANSAAVAADYLNRTVPNLSSIVVLAEWKGKGAGSKRMLLTGDAGGDFILDGLAGAGLLKAGKIHVDLLKVQHHGSRHSIEQSYFEKVTADSYVISGDGKHGNPAIEALQWLSAARKGEAYDAYLTNRKLKENLTKPLAAFLASEAKAQPKHKYHFREDKALSIEVDL